MSAGTKVRGIYIGGSDEAALLMGQLAVAHQSDEARQEGRCAKVCACLDHREYQGELPQLAKDV